MEAHQAGFWIKVKVQARSELLQIKTIQIFSTFDRSGGKFSSPLVEIK